MIKKPLLTRSVDIRVVVLVDVHTKQRVSRPPASALRLLAAPVGASRSRGAIQALDARNASIDDLGRPAIGGVHDVRVRLRGQTFWYVLQCIAFGHGYFIKAPVKKALSELAQIPSPVESLATQQAMLQQMAIQQQQIQRHQQGQYTPPPPAGQIPPPPPSAIPPPPS